MNQQVKESVEEIFRISDTQGDYVADKRHSKPERTEESTPIEDIPTINAIYDRKKLLEITASLIAETHQRLAGERFRPKEGDKDRLAYIRACKELIALYATLLRDAEAPPLVGIEKPKTIYDEIIDECDEIVKV